jgi:Lysylphosphatidylglycerol synthase TM region
VLGPLLFVLIAVSIYRQLVALPKLELHWNHLKQAVMQEGWMFIGIMLCLMMLNWGLEALKWRQLVKHLMPITFSQAFRGVLAGVSFTMITPNRMGEFLGRVLYMPDGSRIKAAALTAMGSLSQLIVTLFTGLLGTWYLQHQATNSAQWPALLTKALVVGTSVALLLALLVFFNIGKTIRLLEKWPPLSKYFAFIHAIGEIAWPELLKLLGLAFLRYLIFLAQYWWVFSSFDLPISVNDLFGATAVMFLMIAIIPTISLAELGVRGKISLYVFGLFCTDELGILVASGAIWLINIILPAFAGSLIMLSVRLFGNKSLSAS